MVQQVFQLLFGVVGRKIMFGDTGAVSVRRFQAVFLHERRQDPARLFPFAPQLFIFSTLFPSCLFRAVYAKRSIFVNAFLIVTGKHLKFKIKCGSLADRKCAPAGPGRVKNSKFCGKGAETGRLPRHSPKRLRLSPRQDGTGRASRPRHFVRRGGCYPTAGAG